MHLGRLPDIDEWTLEITPRGSVQAADCLYRVDVAGLDGDALAAVEVEQAAIARTRLDPGAGRLVQALWFDAGAGRPGRLLLLIHHLAVDGVSWRILREGEF